MQRKRKKGIDDKDEKPLCFKCGNEITPNTLYCPECNRRQPIPMEALERAFGDDMPKFKGLLEKELEQDPRNFYRHFLLGNALFLSGDYQGAIHRYRMSLDLKPDFGDAKLNLGYVLKLTGQNNAAIEMLEAFRRENPHSSKVEAAHKLVCEMKGLPWQPRKPAGGAIPEILKPGTGRERVPLRRERLNVPSLVFVCLILVLAAFVFMRRDVVTAAYARTAGAIGGFLSSDVDSGDIPEETEEEGSDASSDSEEPGGNDLLAGIFGWREAEEVLEDEDWKDDPTKGPVVPETSGDENGQEEEAATSELPVNMEPESDSYWPMKAGNAWKYKGYELDSRTSLVQGSEKSGTIRVTKVARGGDTPVYEVEHLGNISYFYENSDGIYKTNYPERPFSTAIPNIVKPVTIGEKWVDQGLGLGYEVVREVDIDTPAGLFRTMQVKTWLTDYPEQITEVFFGKGVGPVKIATGSPKKGFRIWELTSYKVE